MKKTAHSPFGTVAVVGIGGIYPDAPDLERFWKNILSGHSAARDIPSDRWAVSPDDVYSPEVGKKDSVYSKKGCFLAGTPRFPSTGASGPKIPSGLDPLFHVLLHAGRQAFADGITSPLDPSRVGVIIGNLALPTEKSSLFSREIIGKTLEEKIFGESRTKLSVDPLNRYPAGLPAGLLAHALGLGGGACTLDAACASSLYAIKLAAMELLSGRADAMLSGGVSRPDPLYTQMGFSQLRALSKRGICSPFDAAGDGLVVGEGAGIFLLKRTEDAIAHGDRIYGIIRGAGLANDVGGSLLAPMSEGQLRAMRAAYASAGLDPGDMDMIECHATGTPVGDATEVASLKELWRTVDNGRNCIIGSVKSNIGHLLTAAGAAALTKTLLAMGEGILPPTANFNGPQPGMELDKSPFRVLSKPQEWQRRGEGIPRRAAVSAFGFGGINAHLIVEEWLPESADMGATIAVANNWGGSPVIVPHEGCDIAVIGMDARLAGSGSLGEFRSIAFGLTEPASPVEPRQWWGAESTTWLQGLLKGGRLKGRYLDGVSVSTDRFRIPPLELQEMLPQQLLMLESAAAALEDCGMERSGNINTGVFIGIALDMNSNNFSLRWTLPQSVKSWTESRGLAKEELDSWTESLKDAVSPPLTANRTMGALGNIVASRIAREFKCGGPSFTFSSEDSSGISSLAAAVRLLVSGEIDRAIVGAVDLAGDLRAVLGRQLIEKVGAVGESTPFDAASCGAEAGDGAAAVVLKRLDDARRDGDRVYAVIKGVGITSGSIASPGESTVSGSFVRACQEAAIAPSQIGFIDCNAGGLQAEDSRELAALRPHFEKSSELPVMVRESRRVALGAVKGFTGHCGAASGVASLVRAALALHHETIPASKAVEAPIDGLSQPSPFYLPDESRYWLRNRAEGPRYAAVGVSGIAGTSAHLILAESEEREEIPGIRAPGSVGETLYAISAQDRDSLAAKLVSLAAALKSGNEVSAVAKSAAGSYADGDPLAIAIVARGSDELTDLLEIAEKTVTQDRPPQLPPQLRDRLFFTTEPLGREGKVAFVFPGSGNHFSKMGLELSTVWPRVFQRQDRENLYLRSQFQPEVFWNGAPVEEMDQDHRAVIFGQVATGCAVSDIVKSFGIKPSAYIGYSLGESASLFASGTWHERDSMLTQMYDSTLFTDDLAGECRAAARAWGLPEGKGVEWEIGVVSAPAREVRRAIRMTTKVYLLIINTQNECVIGGDARGVRRVVGILGAPFFPLSGVTTVHCEVAREVAEPYRNLHLFETDPPAGVTFYSGAEGASYEVSRESAADAILAQALEGINYPAVINAAYNEGVRIFLEMGPGASCSRMISQILEGKPHLARSACSPQLDGEGAILRLLANLIAERLPLELNGLYPAETASLHAQQKQNQLFITRGGDVLSPAQMPRVKTAPPEPQPKAVTTAQPARGLIPGPQPQSELSDPLMQGFSAVLHAKIDAHDSFLRFSESLSSSMAQALSLEMALQQALGGEPAETVQPLPRYQPISRPCMFDRAACFEFAIGSVAKMLGEKFAGADSFPTRVRLPDEPLMLVDRIVTLEGEPLSMTSGRVVTEHDIHQGAWYLDGGRIPTCIAVEAGQADLFLSGYLGIDFITKGMAVYRLLDAVVTFHRGLPQPGEVISYDIRIERFFRQGDTWLFRFFFEATVNGEPLLSMRDGCAGFFSSEELDAGKGIVRPAVDMRPTSGIRPADWQDLVPMSQESYTGQQLDHLRRGDLQGCFGERFAGLAVNKPLTIPGGRMQLVHRVMDLQPRGGRYGEGFIQAEADIHPDDWFITCHFVDDRVMPGTLMYECCMHTLRIFLLRMGWVAEDDGSSVFEPVPGVASGLKCRGQVLETTKVVTYEVSIRELGYGPEPFVICDALMYADGKPIVEISTMSARLTGTSKEKLLALWQQNSTVTHAADPRKPAIYTKNQILAYSNGNPSEGFGDRYKIFDAGAGRKIARLPGPPFQFMDRVTAVKGEPWQMTAGAMAEAQYDLPVDDWFFAVERQPRMPFSVLLEAALQPCGWLAAYVGSALQSQVDISFRNLGGSAVQLRPVTPESGVLTCTATLKKAATSGGMIIQEFDFTVADATGLIYKGETMFGFFSSEALANQVGIRDARPYLPTDAEAERSRSLDYPTDAPFPEKKLQMIDRIESFIADGGPASLGYICGIKHVDPDEWFFKAHFYEDPVTPGSLGLESFMQLLKFAAVERWGWQEGDLFEAAALNTTHRWLYRGQIIPTNSTVTVTAWVTALDDASRTLTAAGYLSVDGKTIYQMNDFSLRISAELQQ